ncbi:MAG: yunB [Clostridiales bacterium]|jgi:sporulation protein YunB|nr:yunB [Clostridiales bacterium]
MSRPLRRKKRRRAIILILIFILLIYLFYKIDRDFKPIMLAVCDSEARYVSTETINSTIREEFGNKISYDDLMTIKTDKDGNVVMIQANTVELNRIGSQIALSVQEKIRGIGVRGVKIPIGVILKNDLFAYYGPKVKFNMLPMGSVITSYRSEFQAAGINQTRHIVYLDVTANVQVVVPIARNSIAVTSSIPIAESIIVGKVPNTYANFGEGVINEGYKTKDLENNK